MPSSSVQKAGGLRSRVSRLCVLGVGVGSLIGGFTVLGGGAPAGALPPALYVASSGHDTANNCQSQSAPCLTLQRAYSLASGSTVIHLAGGTFSGGIHISKNITITGTISDGSLNVLTTTINRVVGSTSGGFLFQVGGGAKVTIENLVVDGQGTTGEGGIQNDGTLTLTNVNSVFNDAAVLAGAGVENFNGTLTMNGGSISNNTSGRGGGFYNQGTATLNNVALNHDVSENEGGGIFNFSGTLKLTGSTALHNNSAAFTGGGIENCLINGAVLITESTTSNTANTPNDFNTSDPGGDCI